MKKKVIQFIHGMSMGGAETLVKDYCLGIDKNKFDITLLCLTHCEGPYEKLLETSGIKIIYIEDFINKNIFNSKCKLIKIIKRMQMIYYIKKVFIKEKPDIIHSHLTINRYIYYSNLPKSVKIFHTVHSEPKVLWDSSLERKFEKYILNKLEKKYDITFIALHNKMREEIVKMFNTSKVFILNNGIDFSKYENLSNKEDIRKKNNIPVESFVLGHLGRFSKEKNHEFLIEIFDQYLKIDKNAFLLLIGAGDFKKNIIKLIKEKSIQDKVKILSNRTDIAELLKCIDCFVFPSLYEGLPISLVEAQKSKLKCIISDNITKDVEISNLMKRVSLKKNSNYWANQIKNFNIKEVKYNNLEDWNMKNIIKKLEEIYSK